MSGVDEIVSGANPGQRPVDENSNPNAAEAAQIHGGGASKIDRSNVEPVHGGGVPLSDQGTASVQLSNVLVPLGAAVHPHQIGGSFISNFVFSNPFDVSAPGRTGVQPQASAIVAVSPSNDSAAPSGSQPEQDRLTGDRAVAKNFSEMSAEDLSQVLVGKITTLPTDCWIQEDLSGAVFLEHVEPSNLGEILEFTAKISSSLMRTRAIAIILALIEQDPTIPAQLKKKWTDFRAAKLAAAFAAVPSAQPSALMPNALFRTPVSSSPSAAVNQNLSFSSPGFFGDVNVSNSASAAPSFLSEFSTSFRMGSPSVAADATHGRASVQTPLTAVGGSVNPFNGNLQITINQPSAEPPKFMILESCSDSAQFYLWLKKNRKEFLLSRKVDHKMWNELVSHDAREEIVRILYTARRSPEWASKLFNDTDCRVPEEWPEVSEALLLKILFGLHGPRNANAAFERLISRLFHFNDSTTDQSLFTGKARKFLNEFKRTIQDFAYNHGQWPLNDKLTKEMMRDALTKVFSSTDTVKGRDGTTNVPKCSNLAIVKDIIRQKKDLTIEEIINHVIDHFERIDIQIRSTKGLAYSIIPWNVQARKAHKRAFNQVGGAAAPNGGAARPPRQPALYPRCCNCGSKMHEGTERKCYLWGHSKGKGATGVWPENGGPSLRLNPQEWKDWKVIRHAIFYGYPENAGPRRPPA
jgi:hypothetical protein